MGTTNNQLTQKAYEHLNGKSIWLAQSKRHNPDDFSKAYDLCRALNSGIEQWDFRLGQKQNMEKILDNDALIIIPDPDEQNQSDQVVLGRGLHDIVNKRPGMPCYCSQDGWLYEIVGESKTICMQNYQAYGSAPKNPVGIPIDDFKSWILEQKP